MYWPIGAPRIYAASTSKAPGHHTFELEDDAESRETTEGSGSLLEAPSIGGDGDLENPSDASTPVTPMTPMTPGIKPVEHDTQRRQSVRFNGHDTTLSESADNEPLLSLKISRTGHLFAVITSTSLTIWQTKVRSFGAVQYLTNDFYIANCHTGCCSSVEEIIDHLWTERVSPGPS